MSKFEFEWRADDKCFFNGDKLVLFQVSSSQSAVYLKNKETIFACGVDISLIKPRGKTKKRYKAEKLKWQQNNIKVGDWVRRIRADSNFPMKYPEGCMFQVTGLNEKSVKDGNYLHDLRSLKPCKPPKPEVFESEDFRIESGELVFTGSSRGDASWGKIDFYGDDIFFRPEIIEATNDCGTLRSDTLREIADLLDRYNESTSK